MFLFVAAAVAAKAAAHHPTFLDNVLTACQIAGGVAAMSAIVVFAWAKLRLDRVWSWVFKHLKEDQKVARKAELMDALASPDFVALRTADLTKVIDVQVIPQLDKINRRIDDHMEREEAAAAENNVYMRENTEHVKQITETVGQIAVEQKTVSSNLVDAQKKVDEVAEHLLEAEESRKAEAAIMHQHIADDTDFQERVEPFLARDPDAAAKTL